MSRTLAGIGLMVLGIFLYAANDTIGKVLVATYPVGQVMLVRSIAALAVLLPFALARNPAVLRLPRQLGLHLLRILLSTLETAFFYWAVSYLPLADVMIFYLAAPIYVAVLSAVLLRESADRWQALAIAIGFVGVLIVLRPSPATLTWPALIAVTGSLFFALLIIATRRLRDADGTTLVLGQTFGALLFGALAAPFAWVAPAWTDLPLLALLGLVAMMAQVCVNGSLKLAPAAVVTPYQYTSLVWAIGFGYLVFGDIVGAWTLVGAAVIVGAGIVLFHAEQRRARLALHTERPEPTLRRDRPAPV